MLRTSFRHHFIWKLFSVLSCALRCDGILLGSPFPLSLRLHAASSHISYSLSGRSTVRVPSLRGGNLKMAGTSNAIQDGTRCETGILPLTTLDCPPPAPLQQFPVSLTDHIGKGFQLSVAEAAREGGAWNAIKSALFSTWLIFEFALLGPMSQIPIGIRILSFYFADKLWGKDEGILRDVQYGEKAHQKLDIYLPRCGEEPLISGSQPFVLFVHGGSWASGDKWHYALQARRLRREGVVVANVGYGLYPSQTFDGMCDDVNAALDFATGGAASEHGADASKVVLCAHSAGAHLSALAVLRRAERAAERARSGGDAGSASCDMPAKMVLVSGVYDIPRHYLHEKSRGVHLFSPMHIAAGSTVEAMNGNSPTYLVKPAHAALIPPTAFLHSTADTTVPFSSSARMCEALKQAGVAQCSVSDLGEAAGHNEFLVDTMLDKNSDGSVLFVRECTAI